jgi:excinuclease ABC subunit C
VEEQGTRGQGDKGTERQGTRGQGDKETEQQGAREQGSEGTKAGARGARTELEMRLEATLGKLTEMSDAPNTTQRQGQMALLKRWYYRPEIRRSGEIFFPVAAGPEKTGPDKVDRWPIRAILRGVGRVAAAAIKQPADRPAEPKQE